MLTRDSWILWAGIIGSLFVYLANAAPPWEWTWAMWMQFGAYIVGLVSAKLSSSFLPGAPKDGEKAPSQLKGKGD